MHLICNRLLVNIIIIISLYCDRSKINVATDSGSDKPSVLRYRLNSCCKSLLSLRWYKLFESRMLNDKVSVSKATKHIGLLLHNMMVGWILHLALNERAIQIMFEKPTQIELRKGNKSKLLINCLCLSLNEHTIIYPHLISF